jgi:hypothetical protein
LTHLSHFFHRFAKGLSRHATAFALARVFGTNRTSSTKPFCYALHTMGSAVRAIVPPAVGTGHASGVPVVKGKRREQTRTRRSTRPDGGRAAQAAVIDLAPRAPAPAVNAGTLQAIRSELPEPEVFAMMLVGLVLLGYRARKDSSEKFKRRQVVPGDQAPGGASAGSLHNAYSLHKVFQLREVVLSPKLFAERRGRGALASTLRAPDIGRALADGQRLAAPLRSHRGATACAGGTVGQG